MDTDTRIAAAMNTLRRQIPVTMPHEQQAYRHLAPGPYPPELRFLVLTYQLGDLAKCLFRRIMLGDEEGAGYMADAKLALADAFTQCRVLCLELGFDHAEIEELGLMHLEEVAKELKSGAREA